MTATCLLDLKNGNGMFVPLILSRDCKGVSLNFL